MVAIKWDPFRDLLSLQEQVNKLFEKSLLEHVEEPSSSGFWGPTVDIYEKEDSIILIAELAGIKEEDIEIKIVDNSLTLTGERKFEKGIKEENYHRIERPYGKFQRTFSLPTTIQQDKVKASFKEGVLKLILVKAVETKSKKIEIEIQ